MPTTKSQQAKAPSAKVTNIFKNICAYPVRALSLVLSLAITLAIMSSFTALAHASVDLPPTIAAFEQINGQLVPTAVKYMGKTAIVRIEGLIPLAEYTVRAQLFIGASTFESQIVVKSSAKGVIDTSTAKPIAGTYTHVDPDGLFWSMKMMPPPATPPAHQYEYRFSLEQEDNELVSLTLKVGFLRPGVRQVDLAGTGLVGRLYLPAAELGPRPVIIAYGGSEGGVLGGLMTASALANEGFAALGLAYFDPSGRATEIPKELAQIPLEYFQSALRYLKARPEVNFDQIAVMGPSRGGELSLLLGATFREIKAVVAQVPSPYRWAANVDATPAIAAWKYQGAASSFLDVVGGLEPVTLPDGRTAYANTPAFLRGLNQATAVQLEQAATKIENTNGPIFMYGAADDQIWPSCLLVERAMQRLRALSKASRPFTDQSECYANAGHGIAVVPGSPTTDIAIEHPTMHVLLDLGGTPEANAFAQRDAWEKSLLFLRKNLK